MDQRIIALYDDFIHRHLDRRLFLERATHVVGSSALALSVLASLRSNYALAETVPAQGPLLATERVEIAGAAGPVKAYAARPKGSAKLPGIVVVHQNRGLNPHIEDVTRRVALEGYVALGVDCLSALGGTPRDEDEAMARFAALKPGIALAELVQALGYLKTRPDATGKLGAIGFCWGGGMVNRLAEAAPDLSAGVAFYGVAPPLDRVPRIKAAMLLHYAGLDQRVGATRAGYEAALKQAGVKFASYTYEGANHAFFDDTGGRYDAAAAKLAWARSTAFFAQRLRS